MSNCCIAKNKLKTELRFIGVFEHCYDDKLYQHKLHWFERLKQVKHSIHQLNNTMNTNSLLLMSCGGGASDTEDVSNVLALKWTLFRS